MSRFRFVLGATLILFFLSCGGGGSSNKGASLSPGPTNLSIIDSGDHQTLYASWVRPAQGADSFQLEMSQDGGPFNVVNTLGGGSSDTFLSTSTYPDDAALVYRVRGISGNAGTAYSNAIGFRMWVRPAGPVTASMIYNADLTFANHIQLSWTRQAQRATAVRIDRVDSGASTTTLATLGPAQTQWDDASPAEGMSSTYQVTYLQGSASSAPTDSNGVAVPLLAPIITAADPSGSGAVTLRWSNKSKSADQIAILMKSGLDSVYLDTYSTLAMLSPGTDTYVASGLPTGYLSFRAKAIKGPLSGASAPWSFIPMPQVPGASFTVANFSFPSANTFALSTSGRCLAIDTLLPPPRVFEVENGAYATNLVLQSGDMAASAGIFDLGQEPHFFLWRNSASVAGQKDLFHMKRQGTTWTSEIAGLSLTSSPVGIALMGPNGILHFVYASAGSYQHLTNEGGAWTAEDTGLARATNAPWAASLDGAGRLRVFAGATALGSLAGQVALRDEAGHWTIENVIAPIQVRNANGGDMVPLAGDRMGLATLLYNATNYATECWWFERASDGTWTAGEKIGIFNSYTTGSAFILAGAETSSRTALFLNDALYFRDAAGIWTHGTFCPVGYQIGPLAMVFDSTGKLIVFGKGGSSGYYFPQPYLLYREQ